MNKIKLLSIISLAIIFLIAGPILSRADEHSSHHPAEGQKMEQGSMQAPEAGGMMGGGMMRGMMGKKGMMPEKVGAGMSCMGGCGMMHREGMVERHFSMCIKNAEKLGLTDDQLEKLKKAHNGQKKKLIRIRSEIQILNVDLQEELDKDVPDLDRVEKILKKEEPLKTKFTVELLRTKVKVSKILTPEQFEKLRGMMKESMGGRGMKHMMKGH